MCRRALTELALITTTAHSFSSGFVVKQTSSLTRKFQERTVVHQFNKYQRNYHYTFNKMVANAGANIDMGVFSRGAGGRLEDAFLEAKIKSQAAFVAFVTAGFPTAQGMFSLMSIVNVCN